MLIQLAATITGILLPLGYYLQIWKILKTKSAKDISLGSFAVFGVGTLTWFLYGWTLNNWIIMASYGLGVIGSWAVFGLTLFYHRRNAGTDS